MPPPDERPPEDVVVDFDDPRHSRLRPEVAPESILECASEPDTLFRRFEEADQSRRERLRSRGAARDARPLRPGRGRIRPRPWQRPEGRPRRIRAARAGDPPTTSPGRRRRKPRGCSARPAGSRETRRSTPGRASERDPRALSLRAGSLEPPTSSRWAPGTSRTTRTMARRTFSWSFSGRRFARHRTRSPGRPGSAVRRERRRQGRDEVGQEPDLVGVPPEHSDRPVRERTRDRDDGPRTRRAAAR